MIQQDKRWMEASEVIPMFPSLVWKIQLEADLRDSLDSSIVAALAAAHKAHRHPNNFLSGVYYVRTDAGADRINFHDPRPQAAVIRPPVVELTAENTDQVVVRVHSGTLLIFPYWLEHSVDVNPNEAERISISFNVMLSSFTEQLSQPLWSGEGSS